MARVAAWTVILSIAVKSSSLPSALRLLSVRSGKKIDPARDETELSTAIDAVLGINCLMFHAICWKRAALLHHFLGLRGRETTIVFGLRKESLGELKGHAWLEEKGHPILENQELSYAVTYRFPSADTCKVDLARSHNSR